jgi:hypothetical protein
MAEGTKAIVGCITRKIASIEDIDEATDVVVATGRRSPQTTQRDAARSQMLWLWMVGQAYHPGFGFQVSESEKCLRQRLQIR